MLPALMADEWLHYVSAGNQSMFLEERTLDGSPWERHERFLENSALRHFDRVKTPVLIFHGAADRWVTVDQSESAYRALARRGKPAVLLKYRGVDHGLFDWSDGHRLDLWTRLVEWFEEHLRQVPAAPAGE